jgi:hypothetical protein
MSFQCFYQAVKHDIKARREGGQGVIRAMNLEGEGDWFRGEDGLLRGLVEGDLENWRLLLQGKVLLLVARSDQP